MYSIVFGSLIQFLQLQLSYLRVYIYICVLLYVLLLPMCCSLTTHITLTLDDVYEVLDISTKIVEDLDGFTS